MLQTTLDASAADYAGFLAGLDTWTHCFTLTTRYPCSTDRIIRLLHERFDGVWGGQIDHEPKRYVAVVERGVDRPHLHGVLVDGWDGKYPGSVHEWFKWRIWYDPKAKRPRSKKLGRPIGEQVDFAPLRQPPEVWLRYALKSMGWGADPIYVISRAVRRKRRLLRGRHTAFLPLT